jgi:adenylate kinase
MDIILLGDPAAGKATQAAKLLKKYKLIDFDMGKELRALRNSGSNATKKALARTLSKGKLTPTYIPRAIFRKKISGTPRSKGILFDGTPKMIGEAKLVSKLLNAAGRQNVIVIYLSIPKSETIKRMSSRREYFKGKFSKRPDDNLKALKNRISYYKKNISQVIMFFKKKYAYANVSGLGSRQQVYKRILKAIDS